MTHEPKAITGARRRVLREAGGPTRCAPPALAALLWPALTPQAAQGNLRQVLLGLRRALPGQPPGPVVEAERTRIRLAEPPPGTIDRADFLELAAQTAGDESPAALAAMQRAVALVRGEFMAQLQLDGCEEFSDWLQAEREHLRRRVLALLERLALRLETLGRYDEAVPFIEQLVALDPLCEPGYAHLMRLLALKGHSVAALQMYQACVRVLEQELGVAPDERTRQLADRIERGALERPIDPPPPGAAVSPPPGRHPATVVAVQFGVDGARDPDALDAPLHRAQAQATARLQAQGGHVVRTPEGGLLAYFGHPRALEDAARRALQAALPLAALPLAPLRTRVGVHSGWSSPNPTVRCPTASA